MSYLQVATTGVTVNTVCPGYVMTELIERQLENQAKTRGIPKARQGVCKRRVCVNAVGHAGQEWLDAQGSGVLRPEQRQRLTTIC